MSNLIPVFPAPRFGQGKPVAISEFLWAKYGR